MTGLIEGTLCRLEGQLPPAAFRGRVTIDISLPQPSLVVSGEIRDALARLTGIYVLEDE
jgi:hypothetical protein